MASYDDGIRLPNNKEIEALLDLDLFKDRESQEQHIIDEWGYLDDSICWYTLGQLDQEDLNKFHFELEHATCRQDFEDSISYWVSDLV